MSQQNQKDPGTGPGEGKRDIDPDQEKPSSDRKYGDPARRPMDDDDKRRQEPGHDVDEPTTTPDFVKKS